MLCVGVCGARPGFSRPACSSKTSRSWRPASTTARSSSCPPSPRTAPRCSSWRAAIRTGRCGVASPTSSTFRSPSPAMSSVAACGSGIWPRRPSPPRSSIRWPSAFTSLPVRSATRAPWPAPGRGGARRGRRRRGPAAARRTQTAPTAEPTLHHLMQAARAQSGHALAKLARKLAPKYRWTDIVLPEDQGTQLREICLQFTYRPTVYGTWGLGGKLSSGKGLHVLFSGPPGTGKTMAAEVIANELGLDLYKIDLSQVVSKYIGETEKNLDRIFGAAEDANAILFFDEADALFGKRSEVRDSHGRYANIAISYL